MHIAEHGFVLSLFLEESQSSSHSHAYIPRRSTYGLAGRLWVRGRAGWSKESEIGSEETLSGH